MKRAKLQNGDVLEFPDSVDERTIDAAVNDHLGIKPVVKYPDPIPSINRISTVLKSLFKSHEEKLKKAYSDLNNSILKISVPSYSEELKSLANAVKDIPRTNNAEIIKGISSLKSSIDNKEVPKADLSKIEGELKELSSKMDRLYKIMSAERTLIKDKNGRPIGIKINA